MLTGQLTNRSTARRVAALILTLIPVGLTTPATAAPARPNIVFILADDLGWRDLGCYGSSLYETPHIDRLATRGMRFTQAYTANPLCSPTRASILTGLYPARIGITMPACHLPQEVLEQKLAQQGPPTNKALQAATATRLKTEYVTLADHLKNAGYATGHFGKWHLGPEPYSPLQQGFDVDVPHWPGPGPAGTYLAPWKSPNFKLPAQPGQHVEDLMAAEAVKFIQANKDRSFYLNYWAFSVHSPHDTKPSLVEKYQSKITRLPTDYPQRNPVYAGMVECLDDAVGRVVQAIDDAGLADRTIIVFLSDNGGLHWPARMEYPGGDESWRDTPVTSNAPLRGGKATIYEGGTRVPCIIRWPGTTTPGSTSDTIIQSTDFFPTLLEMIDLNPPSDLRFDGRSFTPALKGQPHDRGPLFCHFPHYTPLTGAIPSTYVRVGDFKLIRLFCDNHDQTDRFELYNLRDDIGEQHNLADRMPEKVRELNALIDRFLQETKAVVPKPNPAYRPDAAKASAATTQPGKSAAPKKDRRPRTPRPDRPAAKPATSSAPAGSDAGPKPNILVIFVDDLGYADLGCQGAKDLPTPHIDSLAAAGVRCTSGYVTAPQCSPARAGLITGRYQQRFGHEANPAPQFVTTFGLPVDQKTIADALKATGYATAVVGKWDLGAPPAHQPWQRGFDEFFGFYTGCRSFFPLPTAKAAPDSYTHLRRGPAELVEEKGYLTDRLTDAAVDFISRHQNRPFFLYLAYNAPHWPMEATDEDLRRFDHIKDLHRRAFLAMMTSLDRGVGRVLDRLRDLDLERNTLIFFLSDNGGPTGRPRSAPDESFQYGQNTSLNTPLRGVKGDLFEGGIRIPFLVQYTGTLPAGNVYHRPVSSLDVFPTALAAAGLQPPPAAQLDGTNILPFLKGRNTRDPHDILFWRFHGRRAVRQGDWKLVRPDARTTLLFDLSKDVSEQHDLAAEHPEVVARLSDRLNRWDAELQPPLWQAPPDKPNRPAKTKR